MPHVFYTLTGDPEIEAGIQRLIEQITSAVVKELTPAAVVLHGSLARGEAGAYKTGNQVHVVNDVDLVAVYDGPTAAFRSLLARKRAKALAEALSRKLPRMQVDLITRPAILLRWPPPSLAYFQLLRSARVLYGGVRLAAPSRVRLEDVPPHDIARLLFTRGGGLLGAWVWLTTADGDLREEIARAVQLDVDKAFLACGDALLYRHGQYDHRAVVRAERFRILRSRGNGAGPRLSEEYEIAARDRLYPSSQVTLSRGKLLRRWQGAVEEWLACFKSCEHWQLHPRSYRASSPEWHPARLMPRMVNVARRLSGGLPSARQQRTVLPMLLQLALDDRNGEALYETVSRVLKTKAHGDHKLAALVSGFLFGWHPTGAALAAARQARRLAAQRRTTDEVPSGEPVRDRRPSKPVTPLPGLQWARLRTDVNCQLRRGAWYRIVRLAPLEVVVEVNQQPLPVPRPFVEIVSTPPRRWTVVPRPRPATRVPPSWGTKYAVCPHCRDRAPLHGRSSSMRCGRCNGHFEVAWDEPYLAAV